MAIVMLSECEEILCLSVRELAKGNLLITFGPFICGFVLICAFCFCMRKVTLSNRCFCNSGRDRSSRRRNRARAYARRYESRYFSTYGPSPVFRDMPGTLHAVKSKPTLYVNPSSAITVCENSDNCEHVCPICLEPCSERTPVFCLPCSHGLHAQCLNQWVSRSFSPKCPLCRRELDGLCLTT